MIKIIFIVSAYNEEKNLKKVLLSLKKYGQSLTINDGSIDNTEKIAKKYSDYYLKNKTNKGYDFTQKKGLKYVVKKLKNFNYAITLDGDGRPKKNSEQLKSFSSLFFRRVMQLSSNRRKLLNYVKNVFRKNICCLIFL